MAVVVIWGRFTGQSHGFSHYVISVIYVLLLLGSAASDCWHDAIQTLGTSLGKDLVRGSNLGYSRCTVTISLKKHM